MQITNILYPSSAISPLSSGAARQADDTSSSNPPSISGGVSNYDFTNMTQSQLRSTVNDLIKSGKLSLKDSSPLVTLGGFGNPDQPMNVLSALKQGIDFKQQNQANDPNSGIQYWQNALATLQGLQGTPSGVDILA